MFEAQHIEATKKASTQEQNKHVSLLDPKYPPSGGFTSKLVVKDGQPLLNSHQPSIDLKTACNVMDCMYTDVELTTLAEKSDADIEDSCTSAMYQSGLYLHGLKQRVAYHRQQSVTRLEAKNRLEEENSKWQVDKDKLETENKKLEKGG